MPIRQTPAAMEPRRAMPRLRPRTVEPTHRNGMPETRRTTPLPLSDDAGSEPDGGPLELPVPTAASDPFAIAAGPDGALWFTETGETKSVASRRRV